jgi:hypothetical protein
MMPYWSVACLWCQGFIVDALLECLPVGKRSEPAYRLLFLAQPGAALACPYCGGLIGFDSDGSPRAPLSGWPVFRYGRAELEAKKLADGEDATTTLADWARRQRFTQPGSHQPLSEYVYAEDSPPIAETVP